jgi:hypothetical protein
MTKLITFPENTTQFDCDEYNEQGEPTGKIITYYVEELISLARYRQFKKFQNEIATGLTHFDLIQLLKNNVQNLNKALKGEEILANMAYENINALNHAGNLEKKEPFEVWICTLFMNTKDEDRRVFDTQAMQAKIRNWEGAGIDIGFFISYAEQLLGVPAGALRSPTLPYLEQKLNEMAENPAETSSENGTTSPAT